MLGKFIKSISRCNAMFVIYSFWLVSCFRVYLFKNITDPYTYLQNSTVKAEIVETEHIIKLEYEISCNEYILGINRTQTHLHNPRNRIYIICFIYVYCFLRGVCLKLLTNNDVVEDVYTFKISSYTD